MSPQLERLSYTVEEAQASTGLKRSALYHLFAKGEIKTFKVGKRRMVSAQALREFIEKKEKEAAVGIAA